MSQAGPGAEGEHQERRKSSYFLKEIMENLISLSVMEKKILNL